MKREANKANKSLGHLADPGAFDSRPCRVAYLGRTGTMWEFSFSHMYRFYIQVQRPRYDKPNLHPITLDLNLGSFFR